MIKKITLNAVLRKEEDKNNNDIRKDGLVPAVVYGKNEKNINIKIKALDVERAYDSAGESSLIDLKVDKQDLKVIIKDIQTDVVKGSIIHADFYIIDVNVPIEVEIPLVFINESKAVKELNGALSKNKESMLVKCLPNDLISEIEIDLSSLNTFEDSIKVGDIKLADNITILNSPNDLIVNVVEFKQQEEEIVEKVAEEGEEDKKEGGDDKVEDKKEAEDKK